MVFILQLLNEEDKEFANMLYDALDSEAKEELIIYVITHPQYIYPFAKYIKNAPIEYLEKILIHSSRAADIYKFARDVKGANILLLTQGIIATGNAKYMYKFVKNIPNAPVVELGKAIFRTGELKYIYKYCRDIPNLSNESLRMLALAMVMGLKYSMDYIGETTKDLALLLQVESCVSYLEQEGYDVIPLQKVIDYQKLKFGIGNIGLLKGDLYSYSEKKQLIKWWCYQNRFDLCANYLDLQESKIEGTPYIKLPPKFQRN